MSKAAPAKKGAPAGKGGALEEVHDPHPAARSTQLALAPSPVSTFHLASSSTPPSGLQPKAQFPVWVDGVPCGGGNSYCPSDTPVVDSAVVAWVPTPQALRACCGLELPWEDLRLVLPDPGEEAAGILASVTKHLQSLSSAPHSGAGVEGSAAAAAAHPSSSPGDKGGKGKKLSKEEAAAAAAAAEAAAQAAAAAEAAAIAAAAALQGPISCLSRSSSSSSSSTPSRQLFRDVAVPFNADPSTPLHPTVSTIILPALHMFTRVLRLLGTPSVAPSVPHGSWLWEAIETLPLTSTPGSATTAPTQEGFKYAVRVFWGGAWRRVTVDGATLPCSSTTSMDEEEGVCPSSSSSSSPFFPVSMEARELWPSVLWGAWWKLCVGDAIALIEGAHTSPSSSSSSSSFSAPLSAAISSATDPMLMLTTLSGFFPLPLPRAGLQSLLLPPSPQEGGGGSGSGSGSSRGVGGDLGDEESVEGVVAALGLPLNTPTLGEMLREWSWACASAQLEWLKGIERGELERVQGERNAAALRRELAQGDGEEDDAAAGHPFSSSSSSTTTTPFSAAAALSTPSLSSHLVAGIPVSAGVTACGPVAPRPFLPPPLPTMHSPSPTLLCGIAGEGEGGSPYLPFPLLDATSAGGVAAVKPYSPSLATLAMGGGVNAMPTTPYALISGEAYSIAGVRTRVVVSSYIPTVTNSGGGDGGGGEEGGAPQGLMVVEDGGGGGGGGDGAVELPEPYVLLQGPIVCLSGSGSGEEGEEGGVIAAYPPPLPLPSSHTQGHTSAIGASLDAALTRVLIHAAASHPSLCAPNSSPPPSSEATMQCDLARLLQRPIIASQGLQSSTALLQTIADDTLTSAEGGEVEGSGADAGAGAGVGAGVVVPRNPLWYLDPPKLPTPRIAAAGACLDSDPTLPCGSRWNSDQQQQQQQPAAAAHPRAVVWEDPTSRDIWIPLSYFTRYFPSPLFALHNPEFTAGGEGEGEGNRGSGSSRTGSGSGTVALHRHWEQVWDESGVKGGGGGACPPDSSPFPLLYPLPSHLTLCGEVGGEGDLKAYCARFSAGGVGGWLTALSPPPPLPPAAAAAAAPHAATAPADKGKGKPSSRPTSPTRHSTASDTIATPTTATGALLSGALVGLGPSVKAPSGSAIDSALFIPPSHNPTRVLVIAWRDAVEVKGVEGDCNSSNSSSSSSGGSDQETPTVLSIAMDGQLTSLLPTSNPPCNDTPFPLTLSSHTGSTTLITPPSLRYTSTVLTIPPPSNSSSSSSSGTLLRVRFNGGSSGGCALFVPLFATARGGPAPQPSHEGLLNPPLPLYSPLPLDADAGSSPSAEIVVSGGAGDAHQQQLQQVQHLLPSLPPLFGPLLHAHRRCVLGPLPLAIAQASGGCVRSVVGVAPGLCDPLTTPGAATLTFWHRQELSEEWWSNSRCEAAKEVEGVIAGAAAAAVAAAAAAAHGGDHHHATSASGGKGAASAGAGGKGGGKGGKKESEEELAAAAAVAAAAAAAEAAAAAAPPPPPLAAARLATRPPRHIPTSVFTHLQLTSQQASPYVVLILRVWDEAAGEYHVTHLPTHTPGFLPLSPPSASLHPNELIIAAFSPLVGFGVGTTEGASVPRAEEIGGPWALILAAKGAPVDDLDGGDAGAGADGGGNDAHHQSTNSVGPRGVLYRIPASGLAPVVAAATAAGAAAEAPHGAAASHPPASSPHHSPPPPSSLSTTASNGKASLLVPTPGYASFVYTGSASLPPPITVPSPHHPPPCIPTVTWEDASPTLSPILALLPPEAGRLVVGSWRPTPAPPLTKVNLGVWCVAFPTLLPPPPPPHPEGGGIVSTSNNFAVRLEVDLAATTTTTTSSLPPKLLHFLNTAHIHLSVLHPITGETLASTSGRRSACLLSLPTAALVAASETTTQAALEARFALPQEVVTARSVLEEATGIMMESGGGISSRTAGGGGGATSAAAKKGGPASAGGSKAPSAGPSSKTPSAPPSKPSTAASTKGKGAGAAMAAADDAAAAAASHPSSTTPSWETPPAWITPSESVLTILEGYRVSAYAGCRASEMGTLLGASAIVTASLYLPTHVLAAMFHSQELHTTSTTSGGGSGGGGGEGTRIPWKLTAIAPVHSAPPPTTPAGMAWESAAAAAAAAAAAGAHAHGEKGGKAAAAAKPGSAGKSKAAAAAPGAAAHTPVPAVTAADHTPSLSPPPATGNAPWPGSLTSPLLLWPDDRVSAMVSAWNHGVSSHTLTNSELHTLPLGVPEAAFANLVSPHALAAKAELEQPHGGGDGGGGAGVSSGSSAGASGLPPHHPPPTASAAAAATAGGGKGTGATSSRVPSAPAGAGAGAGAAVLASAAAAALSGHAVDGLAHLSRGVIGGALRGVLHQQPPHTTNGATSTSTAAATLAHSASAFLAYSSLGGGGGVSLPPSLFPPPPPSSPTAAAAAATSAGSDPHSGGVSASPVAIRAARREAARQIASSRVVLLAQDQTTVTHTHPSLLPLYSPPTTTTPAGASAAQQQNHPFTARRGGDKGGEGSALSLPILSMPHLVPYAPASGLRLGEMSGWVGEEGFARSGGGGGGGARDGYNLALESARGAVHSATIGRVKEFTAAAEAAVAAAVAAAEAASAQAEAATSHAPPSSTAAGASTPGHKGAPTPSTSKPSSAAAKQQQQQHTPAAPTPNKSGATTPNKSGATTPVRSKSPGPGAARTGGGDPPPSLAAGLQAAADAHHLLSLSHASDTAAPLLTAAIKPGRLAAGEFVEGIQAERGRRELVLAAAAAAGSSPLSHITTTSTTTPTVYAGGGREGVVAWQVEKLRRVALEGAYVKIRAAKAVAEAGAAAAAAEAAAAPPPAAAPHPPTKGGAVKGGK